MFIGFDPFHSLDKPLCVTSLFRTKFCSRVKYKNDALTSARNIRGLLPEEQCMDPHGCRTWKHLLACDGFQKEALSLERLFASTGSIAT